LHVAAQNWFFSIYNKQQCSVKHNINLINVFIDFGLNASIP
jgi:hypothetical protein